MARDRYQVLRPDGDQASAALAMDLKQRGLLDDTLVIWGGEFGRTPMGENRTSTGRNHHIESGTMWFAGGGIKPGIVLGETDELGFGAVEDRCHVHDIHATMLHLLGEADVPLPGKGFPVDGRTWEPDPEAAGVIHASLS